MVYTKKKRSKSPVRRRKSPVRRRKSPVKFNFNRKPQKYIDENLINGSIRITRRRRSPESPSPLSRSPLRSPPTRPVTAPSRRPTLDEVMTPGYSRPANFREATPLELRRHTPPQNPRSPPRDRETRRLMHFYPMYAYNTRMDEWIEAQRERAREDAAILERRSRRRHPYNVMSYPEYEGVNYMF